MNKLTKQQQKIFYMALVVILALVLFFWLVYFPQGSRLSNIQSQLKVIDSEIAQVERLSQGKSLTEAVQYLNLELKKRFVLLPPVAEDVLSNLSEAESKFGIEVTERSLASAEVVPDAVAGYLVREIPVTMHLRGQSRALIEYVYALRNDFPALVRLRKLSLRGAGAGVPKIEADLEITIYIASKAG